MRQSQLFANTLRETPAEAEVESHRLLLRAGYIRQLAAGIYTYMPLGLRVLRNVENILREELERAGAQELLMPALQLTELWKESGRYEAYGPELIRLSDRHHREFALGPTHEEVITALVKQEVGSYRRLPVTLYQIQTKFRDERRPRSGLLRGREFVMKDAYSFDSSWEGLDLSYRAMYDAYHRIFERCELTFRAVEADAGAIGGEGGTHEFMALADIGEDTIAVCSYCGYAANMEMATSKVERTKNDNKSENAQKEVPACQKIYTPDVRSIDQLTAFLRVEPADIIKTLIYLADGKPIAVLVRGDHEANEVKLKHAIGAYELALADADTIAAVAGTAVGFVGPIGLTIPVLADLAVAEIEAGIAGANEINFHIANIVPGRDFPIMHTADIRSVTEGEACERCLEGKLYLAKGIEVGHVFKLGMKYSKALGARYLDANGRENAMIMGCYGIGVSRMISAIVEQHHDEKGIMWPIALAPYRVHLVPVSVKDEAQMGIAEIMYGALKGRGIDVIIDDRDERAGVKFNDSELIGIPIRIVIGKDAARGQVEYVERSTGVKELLSVHEAIEKVSSGE
ncbi:proline--tRNA ligase [Paenibacillus sp. strain BS8-2]